MGTIAGSTIGSYAGGMLYDSLAGIFDPSVAAQNQAAEIQKMAAANQLKASQIRDVTGTNTPFSFDSQKLQAVLRLINVGKTIPGDQQALVALLKQKNIDLTAFTNATKLLENQRTILAQSYTPGSEKFNAALKPYQDAVANAAKKLKDSQSAFDIAFAKLPAATTQATKHQHCRRHARHAIHMITCRCRCHFNRGRLMLCIPRGKYLPF
jgi:hypothetical protein